MNYFENIDFLPDFKSNNIPGFFESRDLLLIDANKSLVVDEIPTKLPLESSIPEIKIINRTNYDSDQYLVKELLFQSFEDKVDSGIVICRVLHDINQRKIKRHKRSIKVQRFISDFCLLVDNYYLSVHVELNNKSRVLSETCLEYNSYSVLAAFINTIDIGKVKGFCNHIKLVCEVNRQNIDVEPTFRFNLKRLERNTDPKTIFDNDRDLYTKINRYMKSVNKNIKMDISKGSENFLVMYLD